MKKEDKKVVIETLTEQVNSYKHLYVSDISGLDAVDTQALRRACFDANIKLVQVKNTLLKKALENATNNYEEIFSALKGDSAIMLCDTGNGPAKLIKEFRKTKDKPVFKAAFVEECAYVGEDQLESLISIKSIGVACRHYRNVAGSDAECYFRIAIRTKYYRWCC